MTWMKVRFKNLHLCTKKQSIYLRGKVTKPGLISKKGSFFILEPWAFPWHDAFWTLVCVLGFLVVSIFIYFLTQKCRGRIADLYGGCCDSLTTTKENAKRRRQIRKDRRTTERFFHSVNDGEQRNLTVLLRHLQDCPYTRPDAETRSYVTLPNGSPPPQRGRSRGGSTTGQRPTGTTPKGAFQSHVEPDVDEGAENPAEESPAPDHKPEAAVQEDPENIEVVEGAMKGGSAHDRVCRAPTTPIEPVYSTINPNPNKKSKKKKK